MQHKTQAFAMMSLQQVKAMSLCAKVLSGVIVLFYLFSFSPFLHNNLAMTPAFVSPPSMKIWTLITAPFYENRIIFVAMDLVAVIGFSTILEPLWGIKEFMIFTGVVGVASLLSGVVFAIFLYSVTYSYDYMLVPFHGLVALACGYVVAVKQFHPDSVAFPPPAPPTFRVKHLSLLIITTTTVLALVGVVSYAFFWLSLSGTVSGWIYLRFYQKKEQGSRGDMSESFSFATFFPEPIQPPLATLGGFLYHVLVKIKVCPKAVRTYDVSAPSTIRLTLPGTDPLDAQRRKQRALKALDERLNKNDEPLSWPSLDDAGTSSQEEEISQAVGAVQLEAVVVQSHPPPSVPTETITDQSKASSSASLQTAKTELV
ncbi:transmembrane protein 115-like [Halichondria panicea]|uniref:transmembrane protein 115-like n=1 Tax=Halichondria panicea TaxID=6063 RepID=UPI00312B6B54